MMGVYINGNASSVVAKRISKNDYANILGILSGLRKSMTTISESNNENNLRIIRECVGKFNANYDIASRISGVYGYDISRANEEKKLLLSGTRKGLVGLRSNEAEDILKTLEGEDE
ncbi:hypothetical protein K8R30_00215 [archaeon]|nr:hypothetical protein [archaeon]